MNSSYFYPFLAYASCLYLSLSLCLSLNIHRVKCLIILHWRLALTYQTPTFVRSNPVPFSERECVYMSVHVCVCVFAVYTSIIFVFVIFLKFKRHVDMIMSLKICNIFVCVCIQHIHTHRHMNYLATTNSSSLFHSFSLFIHASSKQWLTMRRSLSLNKYSSHLVYYYIHNVLKMPFYHHSSETILTQK